MTELLDRDNNISRIPTELIHSSTQIDADYLGFLAPGESNVLAKVGDTPIYEVKINNNIAALNPGEAAMSGGFAYCVTGVAKVNNQLLVMHMYPRKNMFGDLKTSSFIKRLQDEGYISPDEGRFLDEMVIIGRDPESNAEEFKPYCSTVPVSIDLTERFGEDDLWNILVYNDPNHPGNIGAFHAWV